ncbi:MAG: NADH-quinone oxidoreductase subunit J [Candidatus Thorarchaeota archaeon]
MQVDPVYQLFEQVEFILIAAIVIILAYLALEHKEIVYAAFFFGFMASFVAAFFLLLEAPFIAGMQIAVYTGGISALIIFGVLLLPRAQDSSLEEFASGRKRRAGQLLAGLVATLSAILALIFPWAESFNEVVVDFSQDLGALAEWLWVDNGLLVQMIAIIMITSLIGAVALLKMDKAEQLSSIQGEFGIEAEVDSEESDLEQESEPAEEEDAGEEPEEVDV